MKKLLILAVMVLIVIPVFAVGTGYDDYNTARKQVITDATDTVTKTELLKWDGTTQVSSTYYMVITNNDTVNTVYVTFASDTAFNFATTDANILANLSATTGITIEPGGSIEISRDWCGNVIYNLWSTADAGNSITVEYGIKE